MARERKRDIFLRLLGSKDRRLAASQADDSKSVSSTSELAPTALSPTRANTPDPTPKKQLEALDIQRKEPETPDDVWAAAFRKFQESDGDLAKAYAKIINPAHEEDNAGFDVNFVKSTVKNLERKRDEKQWKVAFAGKSIHVRSQVEKMVKFLLWTDIVVKPALSAQPYAALAWSAVSIFLPLVKAGTELHESMLAGLEEVNRMLVFWKISESSIYPFRSHAKESFYSIFIDLHYHIIRYYAHAVCHLSSAQLSRAWENMSGWNSWDAQVKSMKDVNHHCQNYLEASQRKAFQDSMEMQLVEIHNSRLALEDISRSLEEIQFHYEDQLEGMLLASLHADFKGHKNANPERVQGTCEWVFQDERFHRWRDNESSSLLWISAGPGYGKSVLSRALIDENLLRSSTRAATSWVCYFFFKDGNNKRTRACDAVAAILHQLFAQDLTGNLIKKAKTPYHRAGDGLRESFDELCEILTNCIYSSDAGEIICVLDAFDECEASGRRQIATYLSKFYSTCKHDSSPVSSLKVIITSRNWGDIKFSLEGLFEPGHPSQSAHIDGEEALSKIRKEIELVIEEGLPTIAGHLPKSDQEYLEKRMRDMKNRTYLWLRLFFQIIKERPTSYRRKKDIIELLESLPSEISEVYEKILQPFYEDTNTKLLLQLILAADRPLTLREAEKALTILSANHNQWDSRENFEKDRWGEDFPNFVENCTGFLVVVVNNGLFPELSFLHQTVREFLLGPEPNPSTWKGRFSYPETHSTMLSACLKSLQMSLLLLERANEGDEKRIDLRVEDFEEYAVDYWPHHYARLDAGQQEEYNDQVRSLCDVAQPGTAKWLDHNVHWIIFGNRLKLELESFDQLSLAAFFGLAHLFEKIAPTNLADSRKAMSNKVSPLQAASCNGQLEMVKMLVQRNADVNYDPLNIGSPIKCAIDHGQMEIVEFLLICTPAPIITEEALKSAASSWDGSRMLELIFQRLPDTQISPELLDSAAHNTYCGGHILKLLLHERTTLIPSDQTIYSAFENEDCGPDVLSLLLDRRSDLHVTESMVEEECVRRNGALVKLKFLYERSPDAKASDRALVLAAENSAFGLDIVKFLSEKHPDLKIPAEAFCAAAGNSKISVEMLRLLFEVEDGKQVTTDLILSAVNNSGRGPATLDFLACQDGFSFTQGYLETWFQNSEDLGLYFLPFNAGHLMRMGGDDITISEAMMKGVASWSSSQIESFLEDIGSDFSIFITDDIYNGSLQACQASRGPNMGILFRYDRFKTMELLMGAHGVDIQMKGRDGHRLSKDEAMDKLQSWKKELDDFYANVDSMTERLKEVL